MWCSSLLQCLLSEGNDEPKSVSHGQIVELFLNQGVSVDFLFGILLVLQLSRRYSILQGRRKAGQADLVMAGQSFLLTVNFLVAHPMQALRAVLLPFCES